MAPAVSHPVFARAFPAMSRALEAGGMAGHRQYLLAGLAGQVIDIGAGTGPSFGHYPAADASHDAAMVSFVLCTVPDQDTALAEIRRALRPGGTPCFLEHVRADTAALLRAQRALEVTVWPRLFGGCHLSRDTAAAIQRAGFTITSLEEFLFPAARTPVSFHIAGHATAPAP